MRRSVLWLSLWVVVWACPGCQSASTCVSDGIAGASRARPLVGAIRMDAWQPTEPIGNGLVGFLGPSQWRYRMPLYGVEVDPNTVSLAANTQAVMDQEIGYAHAAGLDYFCFNHFLTELRQSLNLYLSSARKGEINFCLQMGSLNPDRVADAVNLIRTESTYQKVAGGRPLIFFQAWYFAAGVTPPYSKADVDHFRAQLMRAGIPNPYIVVQNFSARHAADDADRYGADAISSYIMGVGRGQSGPFSALVRDAEHDWTDYAGTGKKVVPTVVTGYDTRPDPSRLKESYWAEATPQEIATHLRNAVKWTADNPCAAEANTIQIYAWNEISEGGWLLPSNTAFNPVGTGRLDAIADVLR